MQATGDDLAAVRTSLLGLAKRGEIEKLQADLQPPSDSVDAFEAALMLSATRAGLARGVTKSHGTLATTPVAQNASMADQSSLLVGKRASMALPPIQALGRVTTYGVGPDLIIDYWYIEAVLDAIWKYAGDFTMSFTPYGSDCEGEQELVDQFSSLITALDEAINAKEEEQTYGNPLEKRQLCPDSLMGPEDTCADFYIASMNGSDTFRMLGINIGNGRGPNPFARRQESKIQFVPDFDHGKFHLLVSNSVLSGVVNFPSGTGWGPISYIANFPATPYDIDKFDVTRVSETEYVVDFKIETSACGSAEFGLSARVSPSDALMQQMIEALCPAIDATITYRRVDGHWRPTFVERDAFPTLDIWRKVGPNDFVLDHHSEERNAASGLTGLYRLREQIRRERDNFLNDPTCMAT
jgi:hypothetical protein